MSFNIMPICVNIWTLYRDVIFKVNLLLYYTSKTRTTYKKLCTTYWYKQLHFRKSQLYKHMKNYHDCFYNEQHRDNYQFVWHTHQYLNKINETLLINRATFKENVGKSCYRPRNDITNVMSLLSCYSKLLTEQNKNSIICQSDKIDLCERFLGDLKKINSQPGENASLFPDAVAAEQFLGWGASERHRRESPVGQAVECYQSKF